MSLTILLLGSAWEYSDDGAMTSTIVKRLAVLHAYEASITAVSTLEPDIFKVINPASPTPSTSFQSIPWYSVAISCPRSSG